MSVYLQPVQLSSQAALMHRLLELHLDPRQEVPPHLAGKRLTHHHGGPTEVHLRASDITASLSAQWTIEIEIVCVFFGGWACFRCTLTSHLQVLQSDPAAGGLPTQLILVGFLQQADVLVIERLPAILRLHFPNNT